MAITGAIFDFDGTLVDSLDAWRGVEGMLAKKAQVDVKAADRALLTTFTLDETAAWFHERFDLMESAMAVRAAVDEYMIDALSHTVQALPGVRSFLESCKERGVAMSVVSSSPQAYLQTALSATDLLPFFSQVLSVEDLDTTKRDPFIFDHALELMGTSRFSTWGFDDSFYAVSTMHDAGFPVVGIYDEHDAVPRDKWREVTNIVVDSFAELSIDQFV